MSFEVKTLSVPSSDNIHTLYGKIYIPNGEIKGLFHVVHGMTEHIERYNYLMSYIAEKGFVCFGYDNLGHGKTAKDDSELGFISYHDGWKLLVNDVNTFDSAVKKLYPDKPLILMGHSMGSFIARLAAENFREDYTKIIICGTGGRNPLANIGLLLTDIIALLRGKKHISKTVLNMAFASYNKKFGSATPHEWLTKDRTVIEKYENDKLCNFQFTVSAMHDLIKLNSQCNRPAWFNKIGKTTPVLLISGECDPVGNYGKGVKWVYRRLIANGVKAEIKLYENCRHEILNDTCRDEVLSDIMKFLRT